MSSGFSIHSSKTSSSPTDVSKDIPSSCAAADKTPPQIKSAAKKHFLGDADRRNFTADLPDLPNGEKRPCDADHSRRDARRRRNRSGRPATRNPARRNNGSGMFGHRSAGPELFRGGFPAPRGPTNPGSPVSPRRPASTG